MQIFSPEILDGRIAQGEVLFLDLQMDVPLYEDSINLCCLGVCFFFFYIINTFTATCIRKSNMRSLYL